MRTEWLEYFSDAARLGSIKASADKHSISPQGLSKCIRSLEAELGVKLFERDANSVRLTPEGSHLLKQVRNVVGATHELARQARALSSGESKAPLTVLCSTFVFLCDMMAPLRDGAAQMGRSATYVQVATDEMFKMLRAKADPLYEGRVLCGLPLLFSTLQARNEDALLKASLNGYDYLPLFTYNDLVLVSSTHPLAKCKTVADSTLAEYPVISSSAEQRAALESFLGSGHITSAISDVATRLQAIEDGVSVIFVPPFLESINDPRFSALQIEDAYTVEVGFVYDRSALDLDTLQPLLSSLMHYCRQYESAGLCTAACNA